MVGNRRLDRVPDSLRHLVPLPVLIGEKRGQQRLLAVVALWPFPCRRQFGLEPNDEETLSALRQAEVRGVQDLEKDSVLISAAQAESRASARNGTSGGVVRGAETKVDLHVAEEQAADVLDHERLRLELVKGADDLRKEIAVIASPAALAAVAERLARRPGRQKLDLADAGEVEVVDIG